MTRTLTALWVAGGGLMAAWLAVSPNTSSISGSADPRGVRPPAARETQSLDLNPQADRLRERVSAVRPRPVSRNPFRFGVRQPATAARAPAPSTDVPAAPVPAAPPPLSLAGIGEKATPQGNVRTAIISGTSELFLVREGETFAGRYRVLRIDPNAVLLRDETEGTEITLSLR